MNIIMSSTGFSEPGYSHIVVKADNTGLMSLDSIDSVDNLIIHRCLHLVTVPEVAELLSKYSKKIKDGGKLTVYCVDVYQLCHKIHRRTLTEGDFHNCMYDEGQKNCISTLFLIENCEKAGFKRAGVSFNDIWAKLEFTKFGG